MSGSSHDAYDAVEKGQDSGTQELERSRTAGGHVNDRSQPTLPVVHRNFANPAPLGLISFATGVFLLSVFGVQARGVMTPNILIGVLIFFGGVCQFIAGIMEFVAGNTFGATVFPAYGGFNLSYALIYLPGSGIQDSYTDPTTGELNAMFPQAISIYVFAWFIVTTLFCVAAMRSSAVLLAVLVLFDLELLLLASGYMTGNQSVITASNSIGFVVCFLSYYAGCAGLWAGGLTPINLPTYSLYNGD